MTTLKARIDELNIELQTFMKWRWRKGPVPGECFDRYEAILLDPEVQVSGLVGLRYLVAKFMFSDEYLVIDLPNLSLDKKWLAQKHIRAFHRTIPAMMDMSGVGISSPTQNYLEVYQRYCTEKHVQLERNRNMHSIGS
jgi:hypothetical protein